ncbi:MAG: hypothetical protein KIH62_000275 [Candidatus Kerfeldbacteria bacterium]|nr:hypothetical protein [Candidatus Kerfeldbacteria bacterium]
MSMPRSPRKPRSPERALQPSVPETLKLPEHPELCIFALTAALNTGSSAEMRCAMEAWNVIAPSFMLSPVEHPIDLHERVFVLLQMMHGNVLLSDLGPGRGFAGAEGEVCYESSSAKLVVQDMRDAEQKEDGYPSDVQRLQEYLAAFNLPSSPCKAHVIVHPHGLVTTRLDPGSHKEFVAHIPSSTSQGAVYFMHTLSSFEHTKRLPYRPRYIARALRESRGIFHAQRSNDASVVFRSTAGPTVMETALRLAVSVKDLDITLHSDEDVRTAAELFARGGVNIHTMFHFLNRQGALDVERMYRALPSQDAQIVQSITEQRAKYQERLRSVEVFMDSMRRAREANTAALSALMQLSASVDRLLAGERYTRAESPERLYAVCLERVQGLHAAVNELRPLQLKPMSIEWLAESHRAILEDFSYAEAQSAEGSIDNELRARVRAGMHALTTHSSPRPTDWEEVRSLNDAIAYLHEQMYQHSLQLRRLIFGAMSSTNTEDNRKRGEEFYEYSIIDASRGVGGWKETVGGKMLVSTLTAIGETQYQRSTRGMKPIAIIHNDYVEIAFPTGHHYIELSLTAQDGEYSGSIHHVEASYAGGPARQRFLEQVLQLHHFRMTGTSGERARGLVSGHMVTRDLRTWESAARTLLRLPYALLDLDMAHDIAQRAVKMFEGGVTHIYTLGIHFYYAEELLCGRVDADFTVEHAIRSLQIICDMGNQDEQQYLLQMCREYGLLDSNATERLKHLTQAQVREVQAVLRAAAIM